MLLNLGNVVFITYSHRLLIVHMIITVVYICIFVFVIIAYFVKKNVVLLKKYCGNNKEIRGWKNSMLNLAFSMLNIIFFEIFYGKVKEIQGR